MTTTIATVAAGDPNFSILLAAIGVIDANTDAGLAAQLSDPDAGLTVFAPTNAAFGQLAVDLGFAGDPADEGAVTTFLVDNVPAETLRDVVLYHVLPEERSAADLGAATGPVQTALSGATLTADLPTLVDNEPDLIDPSLIDTDIDAGNGIVHVIDRVLLPIDLPGNDAPTITEIVASSGEGFDTNPGDFDILLQAVQTAGLVDALNDRGADLTTFAPTDAAFVGLAQGFGFKGTDEGEAWAYLVDALNLLSNGDPVGLLTDILLYHVSGESLQASQVLTGDPIQTLQGGTLQPDATTLTLGDADPDVADPSLIATDIQAANGVVHVLDGVLLPTDLPAFGKKQDLEIDGDEASLIFTGSGTDLIDGNGGNDAIFAGRGADLVFGGEGNDKILGGRGKDILNGEDGDDHILGGRGRDEINGGAGNDLLVGGRGRDTFIFEDDFGTDTIADFRAGREKIDLSAFDLTEAELMGAISGTGHTTQIDLEEGTIILAGVDAAHLQVDDFIL